MTANKLARQEIGMHASQIMHEKNTKCAFLHFRELSILLLHYY